MRNIENFEQSFIVARKALKQMLDWKCPATPRNFELFFAYSSATDLMLVEEVDAAAASGSISSGDAERLWGKYFSAVRNQVSVENISERLNGEIAQVIDMLNVASGRNSEYSECLDSVSERLVTSADADTLNIIVASLVETTKEMGAKSQEMHSRLRESRIQIAELKKNLDEVRTESLIDRLTGIANRKHFDDRLALEIYAADLEDGDLCLLIGDIDHFKKFNDTYGHPTGDQVLGLVGQALRAGLKGRDLAARYGGEEFAIILPNTSLEAAVAVADNIRNSVSSKDLVRKSTGENLGNITMSFGAARYRAGESAEDMIERADVCLYAAKRSGRNKVASELDTAHDAHSAVA